MLQPIMIFAFYSFFAGLISTAMSNTMPPHAPPVCWTLMQKQFSGLPQQPYLWRFKVDPAGGTDYQVYNADWDWNGPTEAPNSGVIFPLNLMNLVCFLILAELATRFNSVVIMIAGDLAGASTSLGAMESAMAGAKDWAKGGAGLKGKGKGVPDAPKAGGGGGAGDAGTGSLANKPRTSPK